MKDIKDYEGLYAVTEDGRVWGHKRKHFLSPDSVKGYLRVTLSKNNKTKKVFVHRLVLETFNPIEDMEKLQVNHKNENTSDNRIENLEWTTAKENANYGTRKERIGKTKSTAVYCVELDRVFESMIAAERELGVNTGGISMCCRGERKTSGGYHWQFA